MIAVFADASYWIALTNIDDAVHEKAKAVMRSLWPRPILTTEQVLPEYLNYFSAWGPRFRQKAAGNVQAMFSMETVRISPDVSKAFQAGLDLYRTRLDKGYSLTDCISMQTMRREGLTDVLTNDPAFRAGRLPGAIAVLNISRHAAKPGRTGEWQAANYAPAISSSWLSQIGGDGPAVSLRGFIWRTLLAALGRERFVGIN